MLLGGHVGPRVERLDERKDVPGLPQHLDASFIARKSIGDVSLPDHRLPQPCEHAPGTHGVAKTLEQRQTLLEHRRHGCAIDVVGEPCCPTQRFGSQGKHVGLAAPRREKRLTAPRQALGVLKTHLPVPPHPNSQSQSKISVVCHRPRQCARRLSCSSVRRRTQDISSGP